MKALCRRVISQRERRQLSETRSSAGTVTIPVKLIHSTVIDALPPSTVPLAGVCSRLQFATLAIC